MKKCDKCKHAESRISGLYCTLSSECIRKYGHDQFKIKCPKRNYNDSVKKNETLNNKDKEI